MTFSESKKLAMFSLINVQLGPKLTQNGQVSLASEVHERILIEGKKFALNDSYRLGGLTIWDKS